MRTYKEAERDHYNKRDYSDNISTKVANSDIAIDNAVLCFYDYVNQVQDLKERGKILDYGCGSGEKLAGVLRSGWDLVGIDISEKSILHAKSNYDKVENTSFMVMDCEKTTFPDNTFDVVFDFGTFSSINIEIALPEIIRILKSDGSLVCIETLGHNPIINLKRKISAYRGKRTQWASSHIMKMKNWEDIQRRFISAEIRHFNILSIFYAPFMRFFSPKTSQYILNAFWSIDDYLINSLKLSKYAFKTVAYFRGLNN